MSLLFPAAKRVLMVLTTLLAWHLSGCQTTANKGSSVKDMSPDSIHDVTCANGEPLMLTFMPLGFTPSVSAVHYPGNSATFELVLQDQAGQFVRLDTCFVDGETPELQLRQIIYRQSPSALTRVLSVTSSSVVKGLVKAVFEQDNADLKILINDSSSANRYFAMFGWQQSQGNFATAGFVTKQGSQLSLTEPELLAGQLTPGDPVGNAKCASNESYQKSSFNFGTAYIEAERCESQGVGETTDYRFLEMVITDHNPALAPAERLPITLGPAEIDSAVKFRANHHNACDSILITLPHAEYGASTPAFAGCGGTLPGTPPRSFDQQNDDGFLHYRNTYHGGAAVEGSTTCRHYLFFCSGTPQPAPS